VLHEPFDGATLARGVAALENDDMPVAVGLAPLLQLEQFDLQQPLLLFLLMPRHPLVIRVAFPPGVDFHTVGLTNQHRIVVVVIANGVALGSVEHRHWQKVSMRGHLQVTRW
jgi:hypothetical protein